MNGSRCEQTERQLLEVLWSEKRDFFEMVARHFDLVCSKKKILF